MHSQKSCQAKNIKKLNFTSQFFWNERAYFMSSLANELFFEAALHDSGALLEYRNRQFVWRRVISTGP